MYKIIGDWQGDTEEKEKVLLNTEAETRINAMR